MSIIMTTIDHHRAGVAEREIFACGSKEKEGLYARIKASPNLLGGVLINTCNRTELYLSTAACEEAEGAGRTPEGAGRTPEEGGNPEEERSADPYRMLCEELEVDGEKYAYLQQTLEGDDVLRHLCLLTAGARSRLWGDSQIITQVGEAAEEAREMGLTDNVLNTVFRLGITAGKEIRTNVEFHIHDDSTADCAVRRVVEDPSLRRVLVVGNGTIGRSVAGQLAERGLETSMTLRRYVHGEVQVPEGVEAVPYAERYRIMEGCDAVVSATASPHLVVTAEALSELGRLPRLFIDMALPRDVEPEVGQLPGVVCCDIDEISGGHPGQLRLQQEEELSRYVDGYIREFHRWSAAQRKVESKIRRLIGTDREDPDRRYFPLFVDTLGRPVTVVGGGNIAERRIMTLAEFGFQITVISESLTDTLQRLEEGGVLRWIRGRYRKELTGEAWLTLACTNDRDTNRQVGEDCRSRGQLVNVCDARNESTFWFPAVALNDELTVGLVGRGTDHMNVKKAAAALRQVVERKEYK